MAESSRFWTTNGTGDGTGSGYTTANWAEFVRQTMTTSPASEGVLYGILNSLAVSGTSSPVSIASGSAIGYGYFYTNDSAATQAIATPTTATRIDRIVLRASWAAQTVRITRIAGTEGSGSAPAMTQTAGTTWDIPLATVSITTGGVITVTDARTFCKSPLVYGWFSQALSVAGNIAATKSASGTNVDLKAENTSNTANSSARLIASVAGGSAADPVTLYDVAGAANWVTGIDNSDSDKFKISSGAALGTNDRLTIDASGDVTMGGTVTVGALGGTGVVGATQLASNAVTTAKVADDSITSAKAGDMLPALLGRQGGSASAWLTSGTNNYTSSITPRIQFGSVAVSLSASPTGSTNVTFPVAFSAPPIIFFQSLDNYIASGAPSASAVSVALRYVPGTNLTTSVGVSWLAIGPE